MNKLKLFQQHGVWFRYEADKEIANKQKEILDVLYTYTKYSDLKKEFIANPSKKHNYSTCICSCKKCSKLYNIVHKATGHTFAVGSVCIQKFIDPLFLNKVNYAEKNGICDICKTYKVLKNTNNFSKNCYSKKDTICIQCMKKKTDYRKKGLKPILAQFESKNNLIALVISFHEKEYYKKKFRVVWHKDFRLWFINKKNIQHPEICNKIYMG
jgi:hypothetical protein